MDDSSMTTLSDVRRNLAVKRADLQTARDYQHSCRLRAELELGTKVDWDTKRLGTNAEDRKRAFDAAVEADADAQAALENVRVLEREVAVLETELDVLLDLRRADEWSTRSRLIEVLENGNAIIEVVKP